MADLHLISILLLAVSSSLDNFGTGVSYGLRNVCIPLSLNLLIAFFNSSGTLLSMLFGSVISEFLRPGVAGVLGDLLLIGIGAVILMTGLGNTGSQAGFATVARENEQTPDLKKSFFSVISAVLNDPFAAGLLCGGSVKLKEAVILAAALTLSNISTGIGAGMIGFSPIITTIAVFLCSILAVSQGMNIGHYSSAVIIKGISQKASGVLLVVIGLYELATLA